ncbi:MAG: RNA polymerase sigma factor [Paraeggerthella sp.]|nr:RNA polymerase sigma factor [Paraeggerthella sp.]
MQIGKRSTQENKDNPQPTANDARSSDKALRSDAFLTRAMQLFGDAAYRVGLAQTGSPVDADDIYQDVFLRLLKDTTAFSNDEHLKAWLPRVTINRCRDLARTAWKRRTGPFEQEHADTAAPSAFRAEIWDVVGALPENLRIAVHLFYVEGYSTDEIAHIMQCQPATVRTRLHRARQQIKDRLEPHDAPLVSPPANNSSNRTGPRKEAPYDREPKATEPRRLPFDDEESPCARSSAM